MADDYVITKQMRSSVMSLEGFPSMGYRIYFQIIATKHVDFIELPEGELNADLVAELIEAKVEAHLAIAGL